MEKVTVNITEVKTHNGLNREKNVRERYGNSIQIIEGKLEEINPKRNNKDNHGKGGQKI
jgi:hypothetical protein